MFGLPSGFTHGENSGSRRHGITDSDDGLLRNPRALGSYVGEDECAKESETQTDPVRGRRMRIGAINDRHRGAERGDLRQRQVAEYDTPLDHVATETGANPVTHRAR